MTRGLSGPAIVALLAAAACGGGGGSSDGPGPGSGAGGGTPSCSSVSATQCTQATYGYPTSSTAQVSASNVLQNVDGVSCTFLLARDNMLAGSCSDVYTCGGSTHELSWGPESVISTNKRWTIDSMYLTCSGGGGGGGGGCAGRCSSCISSCRGYGGCCCGSGCICESACTSSCGDNC
jgi:hypothetical protein